MVCHLEHGATYAPYRTKEVDSDPAKQVLVTRQEGADYYDSKDYSAYRTKFATFT
jgi:hypothetical protein